MDVSPTGIPRAVQSMTVCDRKGTDVVPVQVTGADPTVVGPITVQNTKDDATAEKALHEGPCLTPCPGRGLRPIDTVQSNGRARHHDRVDIAHHSDAAFDGAIRACRGRGQKSHDTPHQQRDKHQAGAWPISWVSEPGPGPKTSKASLSQVTPGWLMTLNRPLPCTKKDCLGNSHSGFPPPCRRLSSAISASAPSTAMGAKSEREAP